VAQFYHFAFLVVSLALLGFGASGALLSVFPGWLDRGKDFGSSRPAGSMLIWIAGLGLAASTTVAYAVVNLLPFDSYSLAWDPRQAFYFVVYYLVLTAPFLLAGLGIGAALAGSPGRSHQVYAANLLGSGAGALLALVFLNLAGVPGAVLASALCGLLASRAAAGPGKQRLGWVWLSLAGISLAGLVLLTAVNLMAKAPLGMSISPYKGLAHAQRYPGSVRLFGRWNAISRVDVMGSAGTRLLPGLSYTYPGSAPNQHGLSLDGEALQPVSLVAPQDFDAADYLPEALVFELRPGGRALVMEAGGGLGVLQALAGGADPVLAVSSNSLILQASAATAPQTNAFTQPGVQVILETPRVYLKRAGGGFDILFLPLTDAYRPVTSGAYSLGETYQLTVEAFSDMLAQLGPGGILVVTRWLQTPPSEELRLLATLVEALEGRGEPAAGSLVAYRGVQTLTALVQPGGWSPTELQVLRTFCEKRRYDLVWAPDIQPEETNRFNKLPVNHYYRDFQALLASPDRANFYANYPFLIEPVRDERPFFFHFFKWAQTPELLATLGMTWQPFGGSGYLILLALLALVTVLSLALILAPLALRLSGKPGIPGQTHQPGAQADRPGLNRLRVLVYFSALGLGFLFVEIPLIQRWILLLGHSTYAFTLVVLVLLAFSSLGSLAARAVWLPRRWALLALVGLALVTPWLSARAGTAALSWTFGWRA
ncbi:MAG TPA: hypothetical protein VJ436_01070, partial [Anaerolineales bacterium]|nr:hypothetical protein [Anaerolineales bacterium]